MGGLLVAQKSRVSASGELQHDHTFILERPQTQDLPNNHRHPHGSQVHVRTLIYTRLVFVFHYQEPTIKATEKMAVGNATAIAIVFAPIMETVTLVFTWSSSEIIVPQRRAPRPTQKSFWVHEPTRCGPGTCDLASAFIAATIGVWPLMIDHRRRAASSCIVAKCGPIGLDEAIPFHVEMVENWKRIKWFDWSFILNRFRELVFVCLHRWLRLIACCRMHFHSNCTYI